jgi:hypothetical protein
MPESIKIKIARCGFNLFPDYRGTGGRRPGLYRVGQGGSLRFKQPGTTTLFTKFFITDEELNAIKTALATLPSGERLYRIELIDMEGVVHAAIDKTVFIKRSY